MAIKGDYKKDKSLDWGEYKSPSMIASEFEGKKGMLDFQDDWDVAHSDLIAGVQMLDAGMTGAMGAGDLLWGLTPDEGKEAYEQAMKEKASARKSGVEYKSILDKWREAPALEAQKTYKEETMSMAEDMLVQSVGDNIIRHSMNPDGTYMDASTWKLPDEYQRLSERERRAIREGVSVHAQEYLRAQGIPEKDWKDYYDTAYMTGDGRVILEGGEISQTRGPFKLFRRQDEFEGRRTTIEDPRSAGIHQYYEDERQRDYPGKQMFGIWGDRIQKFGESIEGPDFSDFKNDMKKWGKDMDKKRQDLMDRFGKWATPPESSTPYGDTKPGSEAAKNIGEQVGQSGTENANVETWEMPEFEALPDDAPLKSDDPYIILANKLLKEGRDPRWVEDFVNHQMQLDEESEARGY